jgi:hypothetical protein
MVLGFIASLSTAWAAHCVMPLRTEQDIGFRWRSRRLGRGRGRPVAKYGVCALLSRFWRLYSSATVAGSTGHMGNVRYWKYEQKTRNVR